MRRLYVLAQISGSSAATGTPEYLLKDHLGSTRSVRNQFGTEQWDREYTLYGATFEGTPGGEHSVGREGAMDLRGA